MISAASVFHKAIIFRITVLVLISAACVAGCKRRPDRLVTAEGRVLSGRLESVDGGAVRISGSEIALEQDEGRVFHREVGIDCRGYVRYADGTFTIGNGTGTMEISDDDVASIIWSPPSSEARMTLEVPAAAGWVGTGMELTQGDRLVISASGNVSMETGACGPSGIDYFSTTMALVPGATNGELVMAVGETSPVAAGSSWTGDSPGSGELMLAVNRPNRESVAGVGGSFNVTVIRTPGVLGHSVLYPSPD
ncbi:MAG: hypothetical protein JXA64_06445 [Candidatus Fermentibacteraceae bacterium]|nr:hypothetical protein [Candidatus Fermentibacteraceae bacterium]MBN2608736.1 hypothetical protein [Candidatus Fermentibacteraceae bacterium]